jgi:hypothetical protein
VPSIGCRIFWAVTSHSGLHPYIGSSAKNWEENKMKKYHSVPGVCIFLFLIIGVSSSLAMEVPIFPVLRYTVDAQGTSAFTEPLRKGNVVSGEFHLIVQNGFNGQNRVSVAKVFFNKTLLAKVTDKQDRVDKKFNLAKDGTLTIQLTGSPGSYIDASIAAQKVTQVPLVIRMAEGDAQAAITAANLKAKKPKLAYHGFIRAGEVISQSYKAGTFVKEKSMVALTVSRGPRQLIPLLPGRASASASKALVHYDIDDRVAPSEIETVTPDVKVARTKLLIAFTPDATVGEINALLTSINGKITAMLKGVNQIIVRIPDPGSLSALDTLINTYIAGNPIVRYVLKGTMPVKASLPPPLDPTSTYFDNITHHLDVRAHAAWNAKELIRNKVSPHIIVTDGFGDGPPNADFAVNALNNADFGTGDREPHGYHVLGIMAATYGGDTVRGSATGMYPGSGTDMLTLSVVDDTWGYTSLDIRQKLMELLEALRTDNQVGVILNTSLGYLCPSGSYIDKTCIEPGALAWVEQVRGPALWPTGLTGPESLESRFLHVTAAGNIRMMGDTDASLNSEWNAARLLPGLVVPETGNPLMNLTNTLVIENRERSPVTLGGTPGCLAADSKVPGNLSAIGQNVFSLTGSSDGYDWMSGTSMATPQVAGLAAYMWIIKPGLSPQQIMDILIRTADNSSCGGPQSAPVIDAYAAVLALDRNYPDMEVRRAILDLNNDRYFDEKDVEQFLTEFGAANGAKDYSRYDLNGDGLTGGTATRPFNLNMDYPPTYTSVSQTIEGTSVGFNENSLTDQEIICYYAYSPLYTGSDTKRRDLLGGKCVKHGLKLMVGTPLLNNEPAQYNLPTWKAEAVGVSLNSCDAPTYETVREDNPCLDCLLPPFQYDGCTVTGGGFLTVDAGASITYDAAAYLNGGAFTSINVTNNNDGTEVVFSLLGSSLANPMVLSCSGWTFWASEFSSRIPAFYTVIDITNAKDHPVDLHITWDYAVDRNFDGSGSEGGTQHQHRGWYGESYPCPSAPNFSPSDNLFTIYCDARPGCPSVGSLSGSRTFRIDPGHVQHNLQLYSLSMSGSVSMSGGGSPPPLVPSGSYSGTVTLRLEDPGP